MPLRVALVCLLTACAASFRAPDAGDGAVTGDGGAIDVESGVADAAVFHDMRVAADARRLPVDAAPDPDMAPPPADGAYTLCSREMPCPPHLFCIAFDRGPGAYCAPPCEDVCPNHSGPGPAECSSLGGRRVCVARCDLGGQNTMEGCPAALICRNVGEALGLCAPG